MSEFLFAFSVLVAFVILLLVIYNNNAVVKRYKIVSPKIRGTFKIVHISDLHNKKYNTANTYITERVKALSPDIIVISGDFVDCGRPDYDIAKKTLDSLKKIADVYYVSGNHEKELGVDNVLDALDCKDVFIDGEYKIFKNYSVLGITDSDGEDNGERENLVSLFERLDNYKIAVCHRPFEFSDGIKLSKRDIDLVLCGHEHGGVIRIPFFGALFTHCGFFPKYSKGMYEENGTVMVLSGGLGNTFIPARINNFPEIISIEIQEK